MLVAAAVVVSVVPAAAGAASVRGLPPGAAAAASRPVPRLPGPSGWPFPEAFPATAGTGRLAGGAMQWTDFVYDDYGASSTTVASAPLNPITRGPSSLGPARGQYVYPAGQADNDGADILHAAVGITRSDTVWRVDWNTLADPAIPIAEWAFDTDDSAQTGTSRWPAGANVVPGHRARARCAARGARLLDARTGAVIATFPTAVDRASRSFIVRIPRRTLPSRAGGGFAWVQVWPTRPAPGSRSLIRAPVVSPRPAPRASTT